MTAPSTKHKGGARSAGIRPIRPQAYSYIRFSSPEQAKGDSRRRQVEASRAYAEEHGLHLDESLTMQDTGISAFKGLHRIKGALGEFLRQVEAGAIPRGSVLLVESLDRLSREQIDEALIQFLNIIRAGIKVVTLADNMEYDHQSINANIGQLVMSLVIMGRAHEESAIKSKRVAAAWKQKREKLAEGHKLTAQCPAWLRLSEDRSHFDIIPERAAVIPMIFQLKLNGVGSESIERRLNNMDGWKPKGPRNPDGGWRKSYIEKILHGRAVIGEFQPHRMKDGKRVPDGEPITGYFPRVVDHELFNQVQAIFARRAALPGHGGGINGRVANLFGRGLARCARCDATMVYVNKGPTPRGGEYLQCDKARRGLGCDSRKLIRYDWLESLLLHFTRGLNPTMLLPDAEERKAQETAARHARQQAREGELDTVKKQIENLTESTSRTPDKAVRETLERKLATVLKRQKELEAELAGMAAETAEQSSTPEAVAEQIADIEDLLTRMDALRGEERAELRRRLHDQLQGLIDKIEIKPIKSGTALTLYFRDGAYCNLLIDTAGVLCLVEQEHKGRMAIFRLDSDGNVVDVDDPDDDGPGGGTQRKRRERRRRIDARIAKALRRQGVNPYNPTIAGANCVHRLRRSREPASPALVP
ncbi:MAG: recombinase family protein [Proteobacteria bacterium]|nr:recombinase family protein [Pseudomonadota bacterium]